MKNFVQAGNTITAAAPSGGITSGAAMLFGDLFGIAAPAEAEGDPELARNAPYTTPVRRLDEVRASRTPVIRQPT